MTSKEKIRQNFKKEFEAYCKKIKCYKAGLQKVIQIIKDNIKDNEKTK